MFFKSSITLLIISIFSINIFCQTKFSIEIKGGITLSRQGNSKEAFQANDNHNYEVTNLFMPQGFISGKLQLKSKFELYLKAGYLISGYHRENPNGFEMNNINSPILFTVEKRYHYYDVTFGGTYSLNKRSIFFGGLKWFIPNKTIIYTLERFIATSVATHRWVESEQKQDTDIGVELGFQHYFFKNLFFEISCFRGFIPIKTQNIQQYNLYNQGINLSLGYKFNLKKSRTLINKNNIR